MKSIFLHGTANGSHSQGSHGYRPDLGYIGKKRVSTSNYLFSITRHEYRSHIHAKDLLSSFMKRSPEEHYMTSQLLTGFVKKRGLTFSKKTKNGYRIFTVPVSNTIVPLAKSTFDTLERNAQSLVLALRWVLQSIYGAEKIEDSDFVQSLPESVQALFLHAIRTSPQYFSQLHHPVMKDYPFFEVVGLDLVLVGEYLSQNDALFKATPIHELPFKLLELNAGSPSGASNNMNVLEGLMTVDPTMKNLQERVMPNDHFKVLRETFDSIGREWTGRQDGISIILPPGGGNGAAPEIHQLAAYSGMSYVDPSQLYTARDGMLRLRTLTGNDPCVTSIYSRINADAALYDPERDLFMRDADSGEKLYQEDYLLRDKDGKCPQVLDQNGQPLPLDSVYAIPKAIDLIHSKKIYLGGLNRVLDNKLILSTLTHYAPRFYRLRLAMMGLNSDSFNLVPPETLAPERASVEIIKKNPDDWVVKAPNLSGGNGVHILLTLPESRKKKIIQEIEARPCDYAYQRLVKIARIPVAVKEKGRVRFANLAADLRMWAFFGAGPSFPKPKLTHNGLVRFAPCEKGPLSSIVNTSKGGGYAPLLIIDDVGSPDACSIQDLASKPQTASSPVPAFAGAQIVQIARIVKKLVQDLDMPEFTAYAARELVLSLNAQCAEVLSFLSPRNIEPVSEMATTLEKKISRAHMAVAFRKHKLAQLRLLETLTEIEAELSSRKAVGFFDQIARLHCLGDEYVLHPKAGALAREDLAQISLLQQAILTDRTLNRNGDSKSKLMARALRLLKELARAHVSSKPLSTKARRDLKIQLERFSSMARAAMIGNGEVELPTLFTEINLHRKPLASDVSSDYSPLFPEDQSHKEACVATLWEIENGRSLMDSEFIYGELQTARQAWMKVRAELNLSKSAALRKIQLEKRRLEHFENFPVLKSYQALIDKREAATAEDMISLLPVLPYARYNIQQYLAQKKLSMSELFTTELTHERVAFMSAQQLRTSGLNGAHAGECLARKRESHGLFSESEMLVWLSSEASPLVQAYTLGHELIHFHQIQSLMKRERKSIADGHLAFANFLNFYGSHLGTSVSPVEKFSANTTEHRTVFYGLADIAGLKRFAIVKKLLNSYKEGEISFVRTMRAHGSLFGMVLPSASATQVKAVREIIPCLENAKNIRFAKDLGLRIEIDEIRSALPAANAAQLKRYRAIIESGLHAPAATPEVLQIIGNHQLYGVSASLEIPQNHYPIYLGDSYNSAQQQ
ncbi:MAG: circularly permuted type 2 ATP-grasp protein [Methylotenera sp.]|nr:circularly permuted type 2 ATP-grasp protein [Oligoflexia bacterium]